MKRRLVTWMPVLYIAIFTLGCTESAPPAEEASPATDAAMDEGAAVSTDTANDLLSEHMAAEAMLTAHFIAAAVRAGMSAEEINGALASVAEGSAISEFWISDENGSVVYTNIPGVDFAFPTDPESDSQSAPFAALLSGDQAVVTQDFMPRQLDGMVFKYVGAAGVDQARVVQVGVAAPQDSEAP